MSRFLTDNDYFAFINSGIFNQLSGDQNGNLISSEDMATGFVISSLNTRYDIDAELEKPTETRNKTLIRWLLSLSVYFLYNSVADNNIPERVDKNYTDSRDEILKVSAGKVATDLMLRETESGKPKTLFNWGSDAKRSHKIY